MVGLVISDSFLLCGAWEKDGDQPRLKTIVRIPFTEALSGILYDEAELNSVLASALRQAKEKSPFDGRDVAVALPDEFINHSTVEAEDDLSREDCLDYIHWIEAQKGRNDSQNLSLFGQVYLPDESNVHICTVPKSLIQTIQLSITELGGTPFWMGPGSSLFLDGSGMSEAALIQRKGNRYAFMKVQNNRFGIGIVAFTGGVPKVIATSDKKEDITLASLGLEQSDLDDIPVFCPQKLGRQASAAWETSDLRICTPFDGIEIDDQSVSGIPHYEANILTQMIHSNSLAYSFNFFNEPGITDFFFTSAIQSEDIQETLDEFDEIEPETIEAEIEDEKTATGYILALLLIVGSFIGFNYLQLQGELNQPVFGIGKTFSIERSGVEKEESSSFTNQKPSVNLRRQSKAISSALLTLLTQTDLDRYNSMTITKSFISLEYMSGTNPNVENILGMDPTSFSVEATGQDSTVFLWYYSFDFGPHTGTLAAGELSKMDLMIQLDTLLTDYSLKYFEQVFTENQIYGPLLIWVKTKADILQASAIISNVGDDVLLRKFVLFNESDHPKPRAGFYVSILED